MQPFILVVEWQHYVYAALVLVIAFAAGVSTGIAYATRPKHNRRWSDDP